MKKHFSTVLIILIFLIGLSVMLYPTVSNLVNQRNSTKLIQNYDNRVKNLTTDDSKAVLDAAHKYNEELGRSLSLPKEGGLEGYDDLLNIAGNGIMGYVAFADINVRLPIYHGTKESDLQVGVGHMSQTSLPVGGEGTHAVITGHRGLPSAKLFTDLDKIKIGNVFYIYILNEVLAYQVDQILTVEPEDTKALSMEKGKDYLTCVTCTPYGINTHRLLIRGTRVSYESTIAEKVRMRGDAVILDPYFVAPVLAVPVLLALLGVLLFKLKNGKKKRQAEQDSGTHHMV
jgi:sortase A